MMSSDFSNLRILSVRTEENQKYSEDNWSVINKKNGLFIQKIPYLNVIIIAFNS
jgi:hypothetical protein